MTTAPSADTAPPIQLSLVSHTNTGKTTLARTLLGRDIGEVRDAPHVTEFAEMHVLLKSPEGDVLQLWDTPGFGDSVRLVRRLRAQGSPVGWFLSEVWDRWRDRSFWASQQALRHVRDFMGLENVWIMIPFVRTIAEAVLLYLGVPFVGGFLTRQYLTSRKGADWYEKSFLPRIGPFALYGLLFTIVLLFALQGEAITSQPQQSLGLGLIIALALALWSASGGVGNIVSAVNIAYDEEETRGFVKRKALALGFTLGAILFVVVAVTLIAVTPVLLDAFVPDGVLHMLLNAARWVGVVVAVAIALAVLYRYAPDRDSPKFAWVSVGAAVATVIWVIASVGFSLYVENFGSYSKTYGALAGVAILMLWLWITAFIVLLGAEINAEAEQQTVKDTTVGEPRPLGERGAVKADNLPHEVPTEKKQG